MAFTHLEVHSHFTLLGATPSVPELVARAKAGGLAHLALTDSEVLCGAVAFDRACRSAGIHPLIGMTAAVSAPDGRPDMGKESSGDGHLVLLAKGPAGYRSLCRLSSILQAGEDLSRIPPTGQTHVLRWEQVAAHREGLICISGGRRGWLERRLRAGDRAAAQLAAGRVAGVFGPDGYIAIEVHDESDLPVADEVVSLGRSLGMGVVAMQPVYCLSPADAPRLELLEAIRRNCRLDEVRPTRADPFPYYWLDPAELSARFARFPDALHLTGEIAARCEPCLPEGKAIWPALKLPPGQVPDDALRHLSEVGLRQRYGGAASAKARQRLEAELGAIVAHGYAPLFLVVADLVQHARERQIPVSTRGSVANSLVAYCTGITTVDPVEHGLLFERFLNPARRSPPDIDLDFCSRRRDEVLRYVRDTYGADRVALIGTISTLRPQSAVRETGKAFGLPVLQISRLVSLLPRSWHPDPRRRDRRTIDDVLAALGDPREQEVVRAAYTVVGQPDHLSIHPGGVVITPAPLPDFVPVQWAPKGFLITQFEHADVETLGLPKIDVLGVRALTVLADAAELVRQHCDPAFRLDAIPLDDPLTAAHLERGDTIGVFQCESEGAQRTLRKLRAHTVRDLAVANAFFKPGPATGGMAAAFVRRYRGEEVVSYLHPALEPILAPTMGVLLFQEQILRVARQVAGLTWEQADALRRGMSHFGAAEMAAMQEAFIAGCRRAPPGGPALTLAQAETLWEQVMAFAGYGFNQGHATAYADVSYRSAYLRAHYAPEFLCARLADQGGFHHPAIYIAEALRLGIAVRPPHVNHSEERFTLETPKEGSSGAASPILWMGLGQVRSLRQSAVAAIIAERKASPYEGVGDLAARVELQAREIDHLVRCGALDGLGDSRAAMLAEAKRCQDKGRGQQLMFEFAQPGARPETPADRLAWEHELLGMPVSLHPLSLVAARLPECTALRHLPATIGRLSQAAGVRLPGWTGGQGFFLGDGDTYVIVRHRDLKSPAPWVPLVVRGRWSEDAWGASWFQASGILPLQDA